MSNYFKKLPDFDYVSRLPNARISDYIRVKNLFKRTKIREDIFENVAFFERYTIKGDDRPDIVASKVYGDSTFDWVVLISNNILNIQSEWPLPQREFDSYLLEKYGDYNTLYNGIHHYETVEIKNLNNITIVPSGLKVDENYTVSFYDPSLGVIVTPSVTNVPVTNYEYEEKLNNEKRLIYLLKPFYLNLIVNDLDENMRYKNGSSQYISEDLKRGDNIRLYD